MDIVKAAEAEVLELVDEVKEAFDHTETAIRAGVDEFIAAHLRNSPFSQDTPAWNHFQAGIPILIGKIKSALEG